MLHYFAQETQTGAVVCYMAASMGGGAVVALECLTLALAEREAARRNHDAQIADAALMRDSQARAMRRPARWFENDAWA